MHVPELDDYDRALRSVGATRFMPLYIVSRDTLSLLVYCLSFLSMSFAVHDVAIRCLRHDVVGTLLNPIVQVHLRIRQLSDSLTSKVSMLVSFHELAR
jgi:hypothetical protein